MTYDQLRVDEVDGVLLLLLHVHGFSRVELRALADTLRQQLLEADLPGVVIVASD